MLAATEEIAVDATIEAVLPGLGGIFMIKEEHNSSTEDFSHLFCFIPTGFGETSYNTEVDCG